MGFNKNNANIYENNIPLAKLKNLESRIEALETIIERILYLGDTCHDIRCSLNEISKEYIKFLCDDSKVTDAELKKVCRAILDLNSKHF